MVNLNISIKKEAYDFLKKKKGKKSFSDVILEFKKKKSPLDFFGVLKDKDWKETEERMESFRQSFGKKIGKK